MADTTQGKRSRKPNFTDLEVKVMLEEIAKEKTLLQSLETTRSVNERKSKKWEEIAAKVNACCVADRTAAEIKEKWRSLLKSTMQKKRKMMPSNYQAAATMVEERYNMNSSHVNGAESFDTRLQQLDSDVPEVKFQLFEEPSMPLSAAVSSQLQQHPSPACPAPAWGISTSQTEMPSLMSSTSIGGEEKEDDDDGSDDDDGDDNDDGDDMGASPAARTMNAEGDGGQTQHSASQPPSAHPCPQGTTASTPVTVRTRTQSQLSEKQHCTHCSRRQADADRLLQLKLKKLELQLSRMQDTQTYRRKQELVVRLLEHKVAREASRAQREEARARRAQARARKEEARARREEAQSQQLAGLEDTCTKEGEEKVYRGRTETKALGDCSS